MAIGPLPCWIALRKHEKHGIEIAKGPIGPEVSTVKWLILLSNVPAISVRQLAPNRTAYISLTLTRTQRVTVILPVIAPFCHASSACWR